MTQVLNAPTSAAEMEPVAQEYHELDKEISKLTERKKELRDRLLAGVDSLGETSAEGHRSVKLPGGGIVLAEKRVRYDERNNVTLPFFEKKGMTEKLTAVTMVREAVNAAIKRGEFTTEELKDNFSTVESFAVKVLR